MLSNPLQHFMKLAHAYADIQASPLGPDTIEALRELFAEAWALCWPLPDPIFRDADYFLRLCEDLATGRQPIDANTLMIHFDAPQPQLFGATSLDARLLATMLLMFLQGYREGARGR
jgi:hypothetical protein